MVVGRYIKPNILIKLVGREVTVHVNGVIKEKFNVEPGFDFRKYSDEKLDSLK